MDFDNIKSEADLIQKTKEILCAPHLELVCRCAGMGYCGGCQIFKLMRQWTKFFGPHPCKHAKTASMGLASSPIRQCIECNAILGE